MATYIDVAALVGIKIHSSGNLAAGDSVTVPTGSFYALVTYINTNIGVGDTHKIQAPMIVGNNQAMAIGAGGQFSIGGVNIGYASGSTAQYVIYTNNQ